MAASAVAPARAVFERRHLGMIGDKAARPSARERSLKGIADGTIALTLLKPDEVQPVLADIINNEPQLKALAERAWTKYSAGLATPATPPTPPAAPATPPAPPTLQEQLKSFSDRIGNQVTDLVNRRQALVRDLGQLKGTEKKAALQGELDRTGSNLKGARESLASLMDQYSRQRIDILEAAKTAEKPPTAEEIGAALREIEQKSDADPQIKHAKERIGQLEKMVRGIEADIKALTDQEDALNRAIYAAGVEAGTIFSDIRQSMAVLRDLALPLSRFLPAGTPEPTEKK